MVVIQQHGPKGQLFDLNTFIAEISDLYKVEQWRIRIEECLGFGADEIEKSSFPQWIELDQENFKKLYDGIYQTIDGEFIGMADGHEFCRLLAVDSSYWEISGTPEFESKMLNRYGAYQKNA